MSDAELARLRRDLDVVQAAAGLRLPYDAKDVWGALGLVPCGAVVAGWAAWGPSAYAWLSVLPVIALALAAGHRAWQRRQMEQRRLYTLEALAAGVAGLGMVALLAWERQLGLPRLAVRGAALFVAGVACLAVAASGRSRRVYAAAAVALVPFGAVLPLCTGAQVGVAGGFAMIGAGLAAAGILAWQLRAEGAHERAAH